MIVTRSRAAVTVRSTYFASRLLSQTGQGLFMAALFLIAGTGDSAATDLSGVMLAMLAGALLLGLPGGALADRIGPSRALVVGAVLRLTAIGLALALMGQGEQVWFIAFVYSAASQMFSPSELALIPAIAPAHAGRAHAKLVVLQFAGQGLSMAALAPVLYLLWGTGAMLAAAFAIYIAVVAMTVFIAFGLRRSRVDYRVPVRHAFDVSMTFRFYRTERRALYAATLLAFTEVSLKGLTVALPSYLREELTMNAVQLGGVVVVAAVGTLIGLVWCGRSLTIERAPAAMRMTLVMMSASLLALAVLGSMMAGAADAGSFAVSGGGVPFDPTLAIAFPLGLALGAAVSVSLIGARSVLTETAPPRHHSRVFATQSVLNDLVVLVPLLLAGVGTEMLGSRAIFAVIGALGVVSLFALERGSQPAAAPSGPAAQSPLATPEFTAAA